MLFWIPMISIVYIHISPSLTIVISSLFNLSFRV